ncbi:MAG: mechanosensitive ion channel family protein [Candidatus Thalassarchaeaceae archaeon]|nr:mechanosensitive ion channel family protein [Candidatus Thalassarchaeaceae archaeon]
MQQLFDELSTVKDWAETLPIYGRIGICIGLSLLLFGFTKFILLKKFGDFVNKTKVGWDNDLFAPISSRTLAFCAVICINGSLAWLSPTALETSFHILNVAYILIFTSMVSSTISVITPPFMAWLNSNSLGVAVTGRNHFVSGFARILVWAFGIYLMLDELKLELTGLLASMAVFSLIAGLALQQTLGNILNSFLLAMDRPFDVGDRIEVDGIEGKVVSTGILSTKVLTWSEELVIIPNNTLVSSTIVNKARGGGDGVPKRLNLLIDVSVAYDEDPPHVKQVLSEVAQSCPYTLDTPISRALLIRLGDYSIDFRLYTWISDYSDEWPARDWIMQTMTDRFREEGIVIPYPINIELKSQPSGQKNRSGNHELTYRRKAARQQTARLQMARADEVHREERESVKTEIEWLEEQLSDTSLGTREKDKIRAEISALASTLDMFDGD